MGNIIACAIFIVLMSCSVVFAVDGCGSAPCASCHTLTLKEANDLLHDVGQVKKIEAAPVSGLWLLHLEKDKRQGVVFLDYGKKNLIAGTVFPLAGPAAKGETKQETKRETRQEAGPPAPVAVKRMAVVAAIPLENSIIMGNPRGAKKMFVFTDPECPFCLRLHRELKKLATLEPDLAIYVKMLPLPMHPHAYDKARAILAGNSPELLDSIFEGAHFAPPGPDAAKDAVDATIRTARSLGITGTPTLVLPDGEMVTGSRDAATLRRMLAGNVN